MASRRGPFLGGGRRFSKRSSGFVCIWFCLFCIAGFSWSAKRHQTSHAGRRTLDEQGVLKPAYCRPGLPGCVPKDIGYVFLLQSPESAHDPIMNLISKAQGGSNNTAMQLTGCNLAGAMGDASYCLSSTGDHHSPDVREKECNAQKVALSLLHQQPFFQRLRCNFATGQYDFSLLYSLPREVLERTLVIFTTRDPIQQTAAIHRVFSQLDPGRMCPGAVVKPGSVFDPTTCTKLSDFVRRGFAGAHQLDALVKRLAGDYCCYQPELFAEDDARIQAAFTNFLRVGVVIDGADIGSGLRYLAHVLGWKVAEESTSLADLPVEKVPFDEKDKLETMLGNDYMIYHLMQQRIAAQNTFLAAKGQ